jgi:myo-inositol-1(or 4)-monophosphatase
MNQTPLEFATEVAQQAGQILMDYYGHELTRNIKSSQTDYSTEADHASEKFILERIHKFFPDDAIVAEESGVEEKEQAAYTWIVDPLDGTSNFANDLDNFGVFIARCHKDIPELAIAFDPVKKQLATAARGQGTFLNGEKIILKGESELAPLLFGANTELHDVLAALGASETKHGALASTMTILEHKNRAYVCNVGAIWDFVVPALLFAEAGWKVTTLSDKPFTWDGRVEYGWPGLIAAPAELHSKIVALLGK